MVINEVLSYKIIEEFAKKCRWYSTSAENPARVKLISINEGFNNLFNAYIQDALA
ncbi:MAG: hypothetical protein ACTS78_01990 [Arsenophonus sp. NC-WZS1-MAG3]